MSSFDLRFEFREVVRSDLQRYCELFERCFSARVDPDYFDWKYYRNPAGPVIAYEARHEGRTAGFYGVIPERYDVQGTEERIFQSMDTMTDPDYRRRGLFSKLASLTYDRVQELAGSLDLIGIPGPTSLPGFVHRLEWKQIHSFRYLFVERHWFAMRSLWKRTPELDFSVVQNVGPGLRAYLANRSPASGTISPSLYPELLEWRVLHHPFKSFKLVEISQEGAIVGICVYTMDRSKKCGIHLLDFASPAQFVNCSGALVDFLFRHTGAWVAHTWEPTNPEQRSTYRRLGFMSSPFRRGPFSARVPVIVRCNDPAWYDIENFDLQPLMQD